MAHNYTHIEYIVVECIVYVITTIVCFYSVRLPPYFAAMSTARTFISTPVMYSPGVATLASSRVDPRWSIASVDVSFLYACGSFLSETSSFAFQGLRSVFLADIASSKFE